MPAAHATRAIAMTHGLFPQDYFSDRNPLFRFVERLILRPLAFLQWIGLRREQFERFDAVGHAGMYVLPHDFACNARI